LASRIAAQPAAKSGAASSVRISDGAASPKNASASPASSTISPAAGSPETGASCQTLGSMIPSRSGGATHGGGTEGDGRSGMAVGKIGADAEPPPAFPRDAGGGVSGYGNRSQRASHGGRRHPPGRIPRCPGLRTSHTDHTFHLSPRRNTRASSAPGSSACSCTSATPPNAAGRKCAAPRTPKPPCRSVRAWDAAPPLPARGLDFHGHPHGLQHGEHHAHAALRQGH